MPAVVRSVLALCALALVLPGAALATSVGQLFPSNALTTHDRSQLTGLRVNLPMPNCATIPPTARTSRSSTRSTASTSSRASRSPFSGPIDVSTVSSRRSSSSARGSTSSASTRSSGSRLTNTLHVESDEQLAQDSTYLLVVTRGVHDATASRSTVDVPARPRTSGDGERRTGRTYRKALLDALPWRWPAASRTTSPG